MHGEPQISFHEIGPPFNSSGGTIIHRVCTDHFIRARVSDKMQRIAYAKRQDFIESMLRLLANMVTKTLWGADAPPIHALPIHIGARQATRLS